MALADTFTEIVDSLTDDWTDLELDLRIHDEGRYIDAATYLVTCNAQPYSRHDWHWRLLVAHRFGHAAAVPAVHTALTLLDNAGITGRDGRARGAHGAGRGHADVGPARVGEGAVPPNPLAVAAMARVVAARRPTSCSARASWRCSRAAGHDVRLASAEPEARAAGAGRRRLRRRSQQRRRRRGRRSWRRCAPAASSTGWRRSAVYSHVDVETRARAQAAGFDLVVPRSRMVREGADLVAGLAPGRRVDHRSPTAHRRGRA